MFVGIFVGAFYAPEGTSGSILKLHRPSVRPLKIGHNSKTNKGSLIILHRKINQNDKVCHAQNLVSNDQDQGHNRRSKVGQLQIVCQP